MTNQPSVPTNDTTQLRSQRHTIASIVVIALCGALFGYGVGHLGGTITDQLDLSLPATLLVVLLLVVLFQLVLLVHECGHLLAGKLVGFRFMLLIVGPLKLVREQHGLHVGINKSLTLWGGLAASVPSDGRDLRRRIAIMVAGGPLASLGLALFMGMLALVVSEQSTCPPVCTENTAVLVLLLAFTGAASFTIFVVTSIPMRFGFLSDGARLLLLRRGGAAAERWCALAVVQGASLGGQRPHEWDPGLLERATALHDGSLDDAGAHALAYAHALDNGDVARAGVYLDQALAASASLPAAARGPFLLEAAYFVAWHRGDAATARGYLKQAKDGLVEPQTRARAEAAVLLAEGKHAEAASRAREGLALLRRAWDAGSAQAEEDWLKAILEQAYRAEVVNA